MHILTIALILPAPSALADMTGVASVIDGEINEVNGQRIKLHEIDAPEVRQAMPPGRQAVAVWEGCGENPGRFVLDHHTCYAIGDRKW